MGHTTLCLLVRDQIREYSRMEKQDKNYGADIALMELTFTQHQTGPQALGFCRTHANSHRCCCPCRRRRRRLFLLSVAGGCLLQLTVDRCCSPLVWRLPRPSPAPPRSRRTSPSAALCGEPTTPALRGWISQRLHRHVEGGNDAQTHVEQSTSGREGGRAAVRDGLRVCH